MSKTGWPPPALMQDDDRGLFRWFASRIDARRLVREHVHSICKGASMRKYPMTLANAKAELEAAILAKHFEHYPDIHKDTVCEISLWYDGKLYEPPFLDEKRMVGIRVTEVGFSLKMPGNFCGSSWMDTDVDGMVVCHAVERSLLARCVDYMEGQVSMVEEIADADWRLWYVAFDENKPKPEPTTGTHVVAIGNAFDGVTLFGPFPNHDTALARAEGARNLDWHVITLKP